MRLYAIRDRLLDYFLQPFVGPSDRQVKAAVAENVNNTESQHAVAKAPHQFELWRLAFIDEQTGQVEGEREYLCDLNSLVRGGVRPAGDTAAAALAAAAGERTGAPERTGGPTGTNQPPAAQPAPAERLARSQDH